MAGIPQTHLRLPDDVRKILDGLIDTTMTEYVSEAIRSRHQRGITAWRALRSLGWGLQEIRAVCDALNGALIDPIESPHAISYDMEDAEKLNAITGKWGISLERWQELIANARNFRTTYYLWVIAWEYWSGNSWITSRVNAVTNEED